MYKKILVLIAFIAFSVLVFLNYSLPGTVILHYHSVNNSSEQKQDEIRIYPKDFVWQMNYLKKHGYHVITLDQVVNYLKTGTKLPSKAIAITFDDGYEDNYSEAFPVLKRFNYPATVFVVTGAIGDKNTWDIGKGIPEKKILNWKQISEMAEGNISFQAHTVHHLNVTKLGKKNLEVELNEPKKVLENHLGKKITYFAYPYGSLNGQVIKSIKESGYKAAFTSSPGINMYDKADLYRIRRVSVKEKHSGFWGHIFFILELKAAPLFNYL